MSSRTARANMIPGSRTFNASRSYIFSRSHRSQGTETVSRRLADTAQNVAVARRRIPKACKTLGLSSTLGPSPRAWGALRKGMSKSFLQHTNAIACTGFASRHPAQGCTGPSESQNFHIHHLLSFPISPQRSDARHTVHGCPSFVSLFPFHKGCISLARTRKGLSVVLYSHGW